MEGAQKFTWNSGGTPMRLRLVLSAAGGWVRLTNQATGKVADVANRGTGDGADVRLWSWLNNNCQQWQLQPV